MVAAAALLVLLCAAVFAIAIVMDRNSEAERVRARDREERRQLHSAHARLIVRSAALEAIAREVQDRVAVVTDKLPGKLIDRLLPRGKDALQAISSITSSS